MLGDSPPSLRGLGRGAASRAGSSGLPSGVVLVGTLFELVLSPKATLAAARDLRLGIFSTSG